MRNTNYLKIHSLLTASDEEFISNAYLLILRRPADPAGWAYYLKELKENGDRLDILHQLHSSTEAKKISSRLSPELRSILRRKSIQKSFLGQAYRYLFGTPELELFAKTSCLIGQALKDEKSVGRPSVASLPERLPIIQHTLSKESPNTQKEDSASHSKEICDFDPAFYLENYPDVKASGIDPREHYIRFGKREQRIPSRATFPQLNQVSSEELEHLKREFESMPRKPLISIVMPTYETNEKWLREAIDSVMAQVYTNWQLCIADDNSPSPHVRATLEEYERRDSRINVFFRRKNGRVSANSNSALAIAKGEYTAFLDHDDILEPNALLRLSQTFISESSDFIYSDELIVDEGGVNITGHAFRPSFSLEFLRSHPYIVHIIAFRTSLLRKIGGFNESLTISQDYDLILRAAENANIISHIPEVLYRWRTHSSSSGHEQMNKVPPVSRKILQSHLTRCGEEGSVSDGVYFNFFETRYTLKKELRVAIIIPTKNHWELVKQCIESLERTIMESRYEIFLVDHDSTDSKSRLYFQEVAKRHRVLNYSGEFNFSAINNWAVSQIEPEYSHYLFCNNDIEAIETGWLERMLELGQKNDVGIVGAKLLYPDAEQIQHAGVCIGLSGPAEHYGKFLDQAWSNGLGPNPGYMGSLITNREMSAVTAALMLVRADTFRRINGYDALAKVGFGDVDLCLRARKHGYRILFCPHATLLHHESVSRGKGECAAHPEDTEYFINKWGSLIKSGDPFYNPHLTSLSTDWQLKSHHEYSNNRQFNPRSYIKPLLMPALSKGPD